MSNPTVSTTCLQDTLSWHDDYIPPFYTLRERQKATIFKYIFLYENVIISNHILLKFVPIYAVNNKPVLIQIRACHLFGTKPLSEPKMTYVSDAYVHHLALMSVMGTTESGV